MLTWDLTSGRQFSLTVQYILWLHILLDSQEYGTHTLVLLRHGEFGKLEYREAEGTRAFFLKAWTNLRNSSWNWWNMDVCVRRLEFDLVKTGTGVSWDWPWALRTKSGSTLWQFLCKKHFSNLLGYQCFGELVNGNTIPHCSKAGLTSPCHIAWWEVPTCHVHFC